MNILYVIDFYKPHLGGVEKLFSSLAEKLDEKGDNITCITWRYDRNLKSEEYINGTKVIRILSPSRMFFSLIALPKIIKEARKADIIHTTTYSSAIGAWIAGKLTKEKVIVSVLEVWNNLWLKLPYISWFEKRVFKCFEKCLFKLKFEKYIAISGYTAKSLSELGIPGEKIIKIYNGIEYNLLIWKDPGLPFTFTYFGRAGVSKGLDLLMDAIENMVEIHPEIKFKFILSPQSKKIFKEIQNRLKRGILQKNSSIYTELPYSSLINELLSSNCIVIPSYCEGFGFSAAEASAMKIPLISSGMGSLPEVVSGKVITMNEFTSESLLQAMEAALNNQFEEIAFKEFTIDEFLLNHISLYEKVVNE